MILHHINKYRVRPSVSIIPMQKSGLYQIFVSDIRKSFNILFTDEIYLNILSKLDGTLSLDEIIRINALNEHQIKGLIKLLEILIERCVIEDYEIVKSRFSHPFRRVLNFIASYVPYNKVNEIWERIISSRIIIVGAGAVGSWVVHLLGQSGIKYFTLIDDDIVKSHNLNRSLFKISSIGKFKTYALEQMLNEKIEDYYNIESFNTKIMNSYQLIDIVNKYKNEKFIVINCADYPSVSQTSAIINEAAFLCDFPYIIGGGYNMHLSLIGPTIIPGKTPCFYCISHAMDNMGIDTLKNADRIVKEHRNLGNLAPLASISASFIANECLKLLVGEPYMRPVMFGKRGEFNFLTKKINIQQYDIWPECICQKNKLIK